MKGNISNREAPMKTCGIHKDCTEETPPLYKGGTMEQQCEDNIHDWEYSSWGIIIGVTRCKKCGKIARHEDFEL
jgi:hypothetical protein